MFVWNSKENYKGKITIVEVKDDIPLRESTMRNRARK